MIDSIIYFVKEYFAIIFYILIIFNIVIRVIVTKKSKKKKSRKGGGILGDIWYVLLCIITFGWSCGFWNAKAKDPQAVKKLGKTVYNKLEIHSKTSPHRLLVTLLGPLIMDPNDGRSRRIYRDGETWI